MPIEQDEQSLALRLRRMSKEPAYACNCGGHADEKAKRDPLNHSTDCRWRILVEAANECEEVEDMSQLCDRLDELLRLTVNTQRGEPPPNVAWSHHDIPQLAALYRAVYIAALHFIGASGWQGKAGSMQYDAFERVVKATQAIATEVKRDFDSVRSALKEGGGDGKA